MARHSKAIAVIFALAAPSAFAFTSPSALPAVRSLGLDAGFPLSLHTRATNGLGLRRQQRLSSRTAPKAVAEISSLAVDAFQLLADAAAGSSAAKDFKPEYSQASYYATLGLFVISFPGAWSLIKRSVQYKPIKKTFTTAGPAAGKEVRQTAAEITAYFRALNFTPEPSKETVIFKGTMGRSTSQALYLTFCTFVSLAALAIVLTISNPLTPDPKDFSPWYYMTFLSPLAGAYYWKNAAKDVTVQVKIEESEDGKSVDIGALGTKEELERMCETLGFNEKGMVRVPGILETLQDVIG